jgi:ADP-heptose:LPS heptosyltransferase
LVIPASKLGDIVCTTPVFRALKNEFPEGEIHVAAAPQYRGLLADNTDVDVYHDCNDESIFGNIKMIRNLKVDVVIITAPYFLASVACFLAGVKIVSVPRVVGGFSPFQTRAYRAILPLLTVTPHKMGQYAPGEYLKQLEPIGIKTEDTTKHLGFSKEAREYISLKLRNSRIGATDFIVTISVSAGNKIKEWGTKNFAEIASWLNDMYRGRIVFIGSKGDMKNTKETIGFMEKDISVLDLTGALDMDQLKALISASKLVICVDSGPIYVAEAFGIPTVDILGPMDENEQPPRGPKHVNVFAPDRGKPQLHIMNARMYDAVLARKQVEDITVEQVKKSIKDLLVAVNRRE